MGGIGLGELLIIAIILGLVVVTVAGLGIALYFGLRSGKR